MICDICPRHCKVDRNKNYGFCGSSENVKLAKADVFLWEGPCISGINGSGAIFFSGCNLKCCFCQNYEISSGGYGKDISVNRLAEIFKELEHKNVHNINLVSPMHYAKQIIDAFKIYKPKIPIVWNSNGYETTETIKMIAPFVDIFLVDLKFFDSELSLKYCKAKDYFEYASSAIKDMVTLKPKTAYTKINNIDILQSGVIVRHLAMPNCTKDSIKILKFLSKYKDNIILSLMGQYTPCYLAENYPEINRPLKPIEYKVVINKMQELGFDNGYTQTLESSNLNFIPIWDLKGV